MSKVPRSIFKHLARRGAEGTLAFPEFPDSEKRTEGEINLQSITISPTRFKIPTGPLNYLYINVNKDLHK